MTPHKSSRRKFLSIAAQSLAAAAVVGAGGVITAPTPASAVATDWLSGVGLDWGQIPTSFATYRGETVTYGRVWADDSWASMSSMGMLDAYKAANYPITLDIAIGGPGQSGTGTTWASAATGAMDAKWHAQCTTIKNKWWPNLAGLQISMAHEMNGDWYPWKVTGSNVAAFKAAWRRFYNIVSSDLAAYNVGVTLNVSAGSTIPGVSLATLWPGDDVVDYFGIDLYNGYGNHESMRDSLWVPFAKAHGKYVTFPEWGLYPEAPQDDPAFITRMSTWFRTNRAIIAGEAYFNIGACALNTSVPSSKSKYASLVWGS